MTFEELDQRFPNGFDDAEIVAVRVNYANHTAILELNLRGNPPESPNSQEYTRANLEARGLYYLSIEPPDDDHAFAVRQAKITVDGLVEDPRDFPLFERLRPTLPEGAFCCRFYVHDWNSFIHIAAAEAHFSWVESAEPVA